MSKASERREARRAIRQANKEQRQAARLARQEGRQGFLSNMVGDGGLGGLITSAGNAFGGGSDDLPAGGGGGGYAGGSKAGTDGEGEGGKDFDVMKFLPLIAIGAFLLLKKK